MSKNSDNRPLKPTEDGNLDKNLKKGLRRTVRPLSSTISSSCGVSKEELIKFELEEAYDSYSAEILKLQGEINIAKKSRDEFSFQMILKPFAQARISKILKKLLEELDKYENKVKKDKNVDVLGDGAEIIKTPCNINVLRQQLMSVADYLEIRSDRVESKKGRESIKNQKEYDEYINAFEGSNKVMEEILTTTQVTRDNVKQVIEVIKEHQNTVKDFGDASMDNSSMLKILKHVTLKRISKILAKKQ